MCKCGLYRSLTSDLDRFHIPGTLFMEWLCYKQSSQFSIVTYTVLVLGINKDIHNYFVLMYN